MPQKSSQQKRHLQKSGRQESGILTIVKQG